MSPRRRGHDARRLMGALEYEVLQSLWDDSPANVATVLATVNARREHKDQLAYTTIMTVLSRLHDKGLLDREKAGRGYAYTPRFDESGLVEHLGQQDVADLVDRYGPVALAQFAAALEKADPATLRRIQRLTEAADHA